MTNFFIDIVEGKEKNISLLNADKTQTMKIHPGVLCSYTATGKNVKAIPITASEVLQLIFCVPKTLEASYGKEKHQCLKQKHARMMRL